MYRLLALLLLLLSWPLAAQLPTTEEALQRLHKGEWWLSHIVGDLLPWMNSEVALGSPIGVFPSTRCDDGTLYDARKPCPEIRNNTWINPRNRYLVPMSRQTFAYGIIFHVTGDATWLDYMKAGINQIRQNWVDRERGGMMTSWEAATNTMGPKATIRNAQELGYGLLGLSFYYYLTRDPDVLPDILAIKNYILDNYYNPNLGALQWMLENDGANRADNLQLTAQLDQMNTYMVLMAPILPEPYQTEWKQSLVNLSYIMIGKFYSPKENLFFLSANKPADLDITQTNADFGHTAKAMWMIRYTGLMTGDQNLVSFSETNARRLFERAYLPGNGSWAQEVLKGGAVNPDKSWWIYCELDQFAGTLALSDPSYAQYLPQTQDYWLTYFVDKKYGGVWNGVDGKTNQPQTSLPKQWQWKSGYHEFEHALVSYITNQQLKGEPVTLYYAFSQPPDAGQLRPYYYTGSIESAVSRPDGREGLVWEVVFRNVR